MIFFNANRYVLILRINICKRFYLEGKEKVKITHIETPESFYVQLVRMQSDLEDLSDNIYSYVMNLAPMVYEPEIGKFFLRPCKFWKRSVVVTTYLSKKRCNSIR